MNERVTNIVRRGLDTGLKYTERCHSGDVFKEGHDGMIFFCGVTVGHQR